jgi:hypothetical protein
MFFWLYSYYYRLLKKKERGDTAILGILVHFRQFRHYSD